jgi:phosphatidylserine/phosphatidylglycerophosphate/cardiolipin synthase-like enzyme
VNQTGSDRDEGPRASLRDLGCWPTVLALVVAGLLVAAYLGLSRSGTPPDGGAGPTSEPIPGSIQVYFTAPVEEGKGSFRGGPDEELVRSMDRAGYALDVAVFRLDLWSVRDALLRAHRRGVNVRVVAESDNLGEEEIQDLIQEGIEVRDDGLDSLMHHKFVIIDGLQVWTGSMNLTVNGAYRNDNNLVGLRSTMVAEDYQREFEEMFLEGRFGSQSRADTPHRLVVIDSSLVEVWFAPEDGVAGRLAELLRGANERIDFMAFAFTLDALEAVLAERSRDGLRVRGVIEADQARDAGTELDFLRDVGVDLRLDGNASSMHHKVMILDERIVVTGSYNFSHNAEAINDENVIIIHDPELAAQYEAEFERVFELASR